MNKSRLIYGFGLLALSLAVFFLATRVQGKWGRRLNVNRETNTTLSGDSLSIAGIPKLHINSICDVEIIPSDEERVVFAYDKEEFKNLSAVEDSTLNIDFDNRHIRFLNVNGSSSVLVRVYTRSLHTIVQEGVGSVKSSGRLVADRWSLHNEGVGSMVLEIEARYVDIHNEGVGSLTLSGSAGEADVENEGTGSIDAARLVLKKAKVHNEGVGSVKIQASETLDMRNEGVGSIRYTGNATVLRSASEGVGSISKY